MYAKMIDDGIIIAVGENIVGEAISEAEYNVILSALADRPTAPSGYEYALRADTLEWELVELPPMPEPEPTAEDKSEAFDILMGVSE